MAKRKAAVKDIIYELDNEDIELSSDEEVREPKMIRLEAETTPNSTQADVIIEESCTDIINIESSCEDVSKNTQSPSLDNGGKIIENLVVIDDSRDDSQEKLTEVDINEVNKMSAHPNTTIFNDDIEVDSPASNNVVAGCENRTPLVTVRFRDNKLASSYKKKLKEFMMNLLKLHRADVGSDSETDLELDIWPEDIEESLVEAVPEEKEDNFFRLVEDVPEEMEDNLFFIDTDPCDDAHVDIPNYQQVSTLITNVPAKEPTPPPMRRGPICFNCDGTHPLRDCPLPRNNAKIAENRRNNANTRVGRYHIEDEQKYGHLVAGRISGQLRHALGLKRHELPGHIYRMRLLGYPPGWLEDARISHSGINMFDSMGIAILDPEEEEGEVCEPGSKDKFDIKKILDFPGFNVPASPRYKEEAHLYGLPPMSDQDSKMAMLQMLAPNAMKAYKRKKLTMFPSSSSANTTLEGQAEMDIDSGDEATAFPSVPPLPDEAPPLPPPPPPPLPESPSLPAKDTEEPPRDEKNPRRPFIKSSRESAESSRDETKSLGDAKNQSRASAESHSDKKETSRGMVEKLKDEEKSKVDENSADDDLEVVNVMSVNEIPMPNLDDMIVIDEDDDTQSSGRGSPSLDDLEAKKRLLLNALGGDSICVELDDTNVAEHNTDNDDIERSAVDEPQSSGDKCNVSEVVSETTVNNVSHVTESEESVRSSTTEVESSIPTSEQAESDARTSQSDAFRLEKLPKTPDGRSAGCVKTTLYGTPVLNIASSYLKLPSDNNFAKDICDVINFENLPNSTGKFKQISSILKKVKNEVDRIQGS